MNWRKIPHPNYGNYGGARNTYDGAYNPIDCLDAAFAAHDIELSFAVNEKMRCQADARLTHRMRGVDASTLSFYGRIYRRVALIVFSLSSRRCLSSLI